MSENMGFMQYLPEIYQTNEFLKGYLALLQCLYEDMESAIENSDAYYDPEMCPPQFLERLGSWLGLESLSQWPLDRLRNLICNAPALYRMRGTISGLSLLLSLYCEKKFYFVESYHARRYANNCPDIARIFGGGQFSLWVLCDSDTDDRQLNVLRELLERHKPAFVKTHMRVLKPSVVLGEYSFLGINTVLSDVRPGRLNDGGALHYSHFS